jgi:hypothetical protein
VKKQIVFIVLCLIVGELVMLRACEEAQQTIDRIKHH